jgi:hypothetical protein
MNGSLDRVDLLVPLDYDSHRAVEKNWVLWSLNDSLFVIYSYDPFVVLRLDAETGRTCLVSSQEPAFRAARFRGSAPPVRKPGKPAEWVLLVHEVIHREHENVYVHRWVTIDEQMRLVGRSGPFVFDHPGVEYATGLCSLDDQRLMVTYGSEDCEARWAEVEWMTVNAALNLSRPWSSAACPAPAR